MAYAPTDGPAHPWETQMIAGPLVTVCIPTRNRSGLLRASLQSVLWQSYRNVEVIVSDNASTDDTPELVASFARDDPRVRHDRLETDVGLFGNLSRCLVLGSGELRMMLPDDDLMLAGNLESKVRTMVEHPEVGLVHSAFRYLDQNQQPTGPIENWARLTRDTVEGGQSFIARSIGLGGAVCVSSVMTRSAVLAGERFDPDDGPYADLGLWLRLALKADVGFLVAPLSGLKVHDLSASAAFRTVHARRRVTLTSHHADALLRAHGRFVQRADLTPERRDELTRLLDECDRRIRLSIEVNRRVPPRALAALKRAAGFHPGGRLHDELSPYSAHRRVFRVTGAE